MPADFVRLSVFNFSAHTKKMSPATAPLSFPLSPVCLPAATLLSPLFYPIACRHSLFPFLLSDCLAFGYVTCFDITINLFPTTAHLLLPISTGQLPPFHRIFVIAWNLRPVFKTEGKRVPGSGWNSHGPESRKCWESISGTGNLLRSLCMVRVSVGSWFIRGSNSSRKSLL